MSDFLMSIIERAASRASVLQRRQRALFEASSPSNDLTVVTDVAAESDRGARLEDHPPSAAAQVASSRESPRDLPRTVEPANRHSDARPAQHLSGRATDAPRSLQNERGPALVEPTRRATVSSSEKPAEQLQLVASRVVDAHVQRRPAERSAVHVESPPSIIVKRGGEEPAPAHHERRRSPRARMEPAPTVPVRAANAEPKTSPPPAPRATTVPTKRASMAAVMLAKAQATKSVSPQPIPAPVPVHISIGRVEVRAAAPQPAARSGKSPGLRLKLDDYLNDRHRGGR